MNPPPEGRPTELTALMIAPDRQLAEAFARTLPETRAFQIAADLKAYPSRPALETRLRQIRPEVVLLDLATDFAKAAELIGCVAAFRPAVHVIGLHARNDSEVILRSLRLGASEFLCAPFDVAVQREAVARIRRLRLPEPAASQEVGTIVAFASAKPGSGASTLASQTAFALQAVTGGRILLADLDMMGATVSFYLRLTTEVSWLEALGAGDLSQSRRWGPLVVPTQGLDVLPASSTPDAGAIEPSRLQEFCEAARRAYDWVILDLPAIFHRLSLLAFTSADQPFLVTTPELPSLHLARKAVRLLAHLGLTRERFRMLVNRVDKGEGLRDTDMERILNCPVHACFPNDFISLERTLSLGRPVEAASALGRSVSGFAGRLAAVSPAEKNKIGTLQPAAPELALTQFSH
ncbi:MAG: P-loop NTPase [Acidobacteriota bacterium]